MIIETVGIVGAGTMGQGIAQAVAMAGYRVILFDVEEAILKHVLGKIDQNLDKGIEKGKLTLEQKEIALSNIVTRNKIQNVTGDLVIEAIVEDLQVKVDLFSRLEEINSTQTIFASNTSSIPISRIGAQLKNPGRLAGLHFFNPAHIMKLVEVIKAKDTYPETIEVITEFTKSIGKVAVAAADTPGFIVNRVARQYYLEGLKILEGRIASHETIDDLLENYGFRMGPFKLMDLIGVDTNFAVTRSIYESFGYQSKFKPNNIQQRLVEEGHYGRKTGKGFYEYK